MKKDKREFLCGDDDNTKKIFDDDDKLTLRWYEISESYEMHKERRRKKK